MHLAVQSAVAMCLDFCSDGLWFQGEKGEGGDGGGGGDGVEEGSYRFIPSSNAPRSCFHNPLS